MSWPQDATSESHTAPVSSVWLIPTPDWQSVFREEVRRLSRELQTEVFEPHVTVLGDIAADVDELGDIVPRLAAELPQFELSTANVEGMDLHFRALYLRIVLCRFCALGIGGTETVYSTRPQDRDRLK